MYTICWKEGKMRRKIQNRRRVNLFLELETYNELEKLAAKRGKDVTVSDVIRGAIDKELTNDYCVENIDLITDIIKKQLKNIIDPAVNRLASLSSKSCVQSSTAAYLCAETINRFVPAEYKMDVNDAYERARKKGVAYTKGKTID